MYPLGDPGFSSLASIRAPIFRRDQSTHTSFYAPGYLAVVASTRADEFESTLRESPASLHPVAASLLHHAEWAEASHAANLTQPFEPVCLTIYPGSQCNLRCTYCYASPSRARAQRLDSSAIRTAGEYVIANCLKRGVPFTTVFHGGGEPGLFRDLIDRALDELGETAAAEGVAIFRYVATNGVLPAARARWLAQRFDTVGLSCDGPERFQSVQRPTWSGGSTTPCVERTAKVVRSQGTPLHVRVTITSRTLLHQGEITQYLCERLRPDEIHIEPLYVGGRAGSRASLLPEQATTFVDGFVQARGVAAAFGIPVQTSGSRLSEIHGPYCNVLRDVLQVVPGGVATTCFKTGNAAEAVTQRTTLGGCGNDGNALTLDIGRITRLRGLLSRWPAGCQDCFNRFHCTHGCPDSCPLDPKADASEFRCQVQMMLARRALDALAEATWKDARRDQDRGIVGCEVGSL